MISIVSNLSSKLIKGEKSANRFNVSFFPLTLDQFLDKSIVGDGLYQISIGENSVDFLIKKGNRFNGKALLAFNGALSEKVRSLDLIPNFTGVVLAKEIGATVVSFFDPVLYLKDDLYIGWYLGWKEFNTQKIILVIINRLARMMNVSFCSFGGSGGGFASLYYLSKSEYIDRAFVWNCQTVVEKYNSRFWRYLSEVSLKKKVVDGEEFSGAMSSLDICTNLLTLSEELKNKSFVYLQNAPDGHAVVHAMPLVERLELKNEDDFFIVRTI